MKGIMEMRVLWAGSAMAVVLGMFLEGKGAGREGKGVGREGWDEAAEGLPGRGDGPRGLWLQKNLLASTWGSEGPKA